MKCPNCDSEMSRWSGTLWGCSNCGYQERRGYFSNEREDDAQVQD